MLSALYILAVVRLLDIIDRFNVASNILLATILLRTVHAPAFRTRACR